LLFYEYYIGDEEQKQHHNNTSLPQNPQQVSPEAQSPHLQTYRKEKQNSRSPAVCSHQSSQSPNKAHHSTVHTQNQSRQANKEKQHTSNNHVRAASH